MKSPYFFCLILLISLFSCKKNPCDDINCKNGGTCKDGICECQAPFSGADCDTWQGQKFLGTYTVSYSCSSTPLNTVIEALPSDAKHLTIRNLGDYACPDGDYLVTAKIANDSLIIEKQSTCATKPYQFEGLGILSNNTLTLHFTVSYDVNPGIHTDDCTAVMVK